MIICPRVNKNTCRPIAGGRTGGRATMHARPAAFNRAAVTGPTAAASSERK